MRKDPATGLTGPQEAFCVALLKTGNQTEAYRQAYPKSLKWKPDAVSVRASKLAASANVQLRLSQLRSDLREESGVTLTEHLRELQTLRDLAKAEKQIAAAITAETNRGKVSGLYVEKTELSGPAGGPVTISVLPVKPND